MFYQLYCKLGQLEMLWKEIAFTQNNRHNIMTVKSLEITILYWTTYVTRMLISRFVRHILIMTFVYGDKQIIQIRKKN